MQEAVVQLVARFRQIGEERMRGLPIYHEALQVEAVGFRPCAMGLIGVLITPWFMNVILLPTAAAHDPRLRLGDKVSHALPAGEQEFTVGEDEVIGVYHFHSLASPMLHFKTQDGARATGMHALQRMLTPVAAEHQSDAGATQEPDRPASRRAFLHLPADKTGNVAG